jgi:hypothetical protein
MNDAAVHLPRHWRCALGPERRNANRERPDPATVAARFGSTGQRWSTSNCSRRVCIPETKGPGSGSAGTRTAANPLLHAPGIPEDDTKRKIGS